MRVKPEYEDAAEAARRAGVPLAEELRAAERNLPESCRKTRVGVKPEYEAITEASRRAGVPLAEVLRAAGQDLPE